MRLDQYSSDVNTAGIKSTQLRIAANAKAFAMFMDRTYTDIKYAICRELMTNGYDSQKQAGRGDTPLQITVPSRFSSTMVFRDFGKSMTHDVVEHVYSTLMESTKDGSDDEVGGWGIGSKTPFGYTNQLTLRCFLNGTVRLYQLFIDGSGVPNIALVAETPTEEPDGVEVSFEVKPGDAEAFKNNIIKASQWFDVKPELKGAAVPLPDTAFETDHPYLWKFPPFGTSPLKECMVRQGCVAYPLDPEKLTLPNTDVDKDARERLTKAKAVCLDIRGRMFLNVPIGTCDVTVSRDGLYYEGKSSENLVRILSELHDEITADAKAEFAKCQNYYEARRFYHRTDWRKNGLFENTLKSWLTHLTYGNRSLTGVFDFQKQRYSSSATVVDGKTYAGFVPTYPGVNVMLVERVGADRKTMSFREQKNWACGYTQDWLVILDYLDHDKNRFTHRSSDRMLRVMQEHRLKSKVIWVRVTSQNLDSLKTLLTDMGNPPTLNLKDVDIPPVERVTPVKRDLFRATYADKPSSGMSLCNFERYQEILDSGDFMFIDTHQGNPQSKYGLTWKELQAVASGLGVTEKTKVVCVSKTNKSKLTKYIKDKRDYVEWLGEIALGKFSPSRYVELCAILDMSANVYRHNLLYRLMSILKDEDDKIVETGNPMIDNPLWLMGSRSNLMVERDQLKDVLEHLPKLVSPARMDAVRSEIAQLEKVVKVRARVSDLASDESLIARTYPWLNALFGDGSDADARTFLIAQLDPNQRKV